MVLVAALICGIGWPVVLKLPNTYEVKAQIHLDTQSILKPLLSGLAVDSELTQTTALVLQRTLLTRPNLEKVARAVDIDLLANTPSQFEALIRNLGSNIYISQMRIPTTRRRQAAGGEAVFEIVYRDQDPQRAKMVVQEILTLFVEGTLGAARKDTEFTEQFLNLKIDEYEAQLVEAEERLKHFKRKNVGLMPREGQNYYSQMSSEKSRLEEAQLQLDEAVNRQRELKRQLNEVVNSFRSSSSDAASNPLDARIQTVQQKLDELELQYTKNHPDVVAAQRMLQELQKQKQSEKAKSTDTGEANLLDNNPVYQELKVDLGQEEAQIAALKVRVSMYEESLHKLQMLIDTMPKVEAEFAKLNRDYGIIKENYLGLVKRRESAKLSFDAENKDDNVNFKVIDPPRVPLKPISPNRLLLITAVLVLGAGAGIALVILLIQLKPTFYSASDLSRKLDLPVLGSVSKVIQPGEIVKGRIGLLGFGLVILAILAAYSGLIAMQLNLIKF